MRGKQTRPADIVPSSVGLIVSECGRMTFKTKGLWAQDYEEDYEEEVVTTKKKSKLFASKSTLQNGQSIIDEDCSLELAFLIDSSESAKDNHAQEKRFVLDTVERLQGLRLQTGRGLSYRAALLQYSSHVNKEQTFKEWRGTDNFKARIASLTYIGHGTYTTYAITNLTRIYLEESDPSTIKVAICSLMAFPTPGTQTYFQLWQMPRTKASVSSP
ncbi:hypothetical protein Q5P01_005497 [Channa striata]|uniref:VWFA domain-containing protein n=1 Tax=Channa striata TaxID=64152 RepID=A0AA88NGJ2_CHASR|nr:hypothetical protein Q5P01_005497 [Channa striata]